jgi:NCS1 family nucleobase:cation symporter-1
MTNRSGGTDAAQTESLMGRLPLLSGNRVYRNWWVWVAGAFSYGAATWGLLTGGFLGSFLGAPQAITAFFLGQAASLLFCAAFLGVASSKFGIDTVDASKPAFGVRGSILILVLIIAIMIGWILVLVALTGASLLQFANQVLGIDKSQGVLGVLSLAMLAVCVGLAAMGPTVFARLYGMIAPAHLVLVAALFIVLLADHGLSGLWNLKPPAENRLPAQEGFALALELGFGYGFGFWISMGALFRLVRSQRMAIHGAMIGWALLATPVVVIAIFSALAVGSSDPTVWMYDLAGDWGGTVAVVFIVLSNVSSTVMMFYIAGVATKQVKSLARVPFWMILTVMALPGIWVAFWPAKLFDWYPTFLYYNAVLIAPIVAILTVDFFVLRRQHIDVSHVFTWKPVGKYWFWGGVNPVSIVTVALGFGFYNLLYNPVTAEHGSLFDYTTASLPTVVVCSLFYYLVMRLVVIPRGVGGYPPRRRTEPIPAVALAPADVSL